jgi:crotonobetainyl-CoA:carnitine CoA-transferase CaiB-like acyl-CoA transferase
MATDRDRESMVQAMSGLMALHGRDSGRPRRLGLPVVSAAAGILACQGALAGLIGRCRGREIAAVRTSALQAGLLVLSHHLTAATCGDPWSPPVGGSAPGPPFRTGDGHWIELEAFAAEPWRALWLRLGVPERDVGRAWLPYVFRYNTARCALPPSLHHAAARSSLAEMTDLAGQCNVAIRRVRTYGDLLTSAGGPGPDRAGSTEPWEVSPPWTIQVGRRQRLSTEPPQPTAGTPGPLGGLRIVEITSRIQGPLAGLLLSTLGAEVIRVEPPQGDPARGMPPMAGAVGSSFLAYNHGKQPVEIDYKTTGGRAAVLELVAGSDVFLHNWRTGRAEELGLGAADLARVSDRLVYAHASGWGGSPATDLPLPATDGLVQAEAACGEGLSPPGEPPFPSRVTFVDVLGGLVAAQGILAALYLRERTGRASTVETSLWSGAMALQAPLLSDLAGGREHGRRGGRPLWGPFDLPLPTGDGYLLVAADSGPVVRRLLDYFQVPSDGGHAAEEAFVRRLGEAPATRWARLLTARDIPCTAVCRDVADLRSDPRVAALLHDHDGHALTPRDPWTFVE